jgi:hypothetical protein
MFYLVNIYVYLKFISTQVISIDVLLSIYNLLTLFKTYQLDVAHHTRALCLVLQRLEQNHGRCFNLCLLESYGLA